MKLTVDDSHSIRRVYELEKTPEGLRELAALLEDTPPPPKIPGYVYRPWTVQLLPYNAQGDPGICVVLQTWGCPESEAKRQWVTPDA